MLKAAMPFHQITITIPEQFKEPLLRKLAQLGSLGALDQLHSIIAYFPETSPLSSILGELQVVSLLVNSAGHDVPVRIEHSLLPDTDWNESWKKGFTSIDVGERFAILPPWERPSGNRIPLIIDPGMAFGTGHHETTRSCLVLMERYVDAVKKERFLDLGTGTGLLAMASLALGFRSVVGIDTDPLAIEASLRNITLNRAERIELLEGGIDKCEGEFDMIAANLISGTLIQLSGEIASRLVPAGIVIMSGILKGQDDEVVAAAKNNGLDCIERLFDGKWVTLACRR
jgi:ribosomal protein L11 methyltransferase